MIPWTLFGLIKGGLLSSVFLAIKGRASLPAPTLCKHSDFE